MQGYYDLLEDFFKEQKEQTPFDPKSLTEEISSLKQELTRSKEQTTPARKLLPLTKKPLFIPTTVTLPNQKILQMKQLEVEEPGTPSVPMQKSGEPSVQEEYVVT